MLILISATGINRTNFRHKYSTNYKTWSAEMDDNNNKKVYCKWCDKEIKKIPKEELFYEGTVYVVCDNCGEQTILHNIVRDNRE